MNVGQILETHLGWAARNLGLRLRDALENGESINKLRESAKYVFQTADIGALIETLDGEELLRFVEDNAEGIRLASPVFDGASEDAIRDLLVRAGLDGFQTVLYDGKSGRAL
jgi:DNA-directed RNA polymerase subunit beta